MPDFTAQWTDGVTWEEWTDPTVPASGAIPGKPSRLNPRGGLTHRYARATVGQVVEATATVDGVEGPPDSALDGRLFMAWLIEVPTAYPLGVEPEPDSSSIVRFTPPVEGHYTLALRRVGGGQIILHVDAGS